MKTAAPTGSRRPLAAMLSAALLSALAGLPAAQAFCGFYVAQGDTPLYNKASRVVLAWDDGRVSVTMASDYRGEPKEFGLVIPVPVVVKKSDIHVINMPLVDKLDAYTAPRLTEYFDDDPCQPREYFDAARSGAVPAAAPPMALAQKKPLAVTIEAQYQVGVYDITILRAEESGDLLTYLKENGYRVPAAARDVLGSYIAQHMHFFLAKVNLERQNLAGEHFLRPIQVSYASDKFMLPIRLGTVNADGAQDLIIYALTRHGRVESTNYRTQKLATRVEVPLYVRERLADVYKAAFEKKVAEDEMSTLYTEYAWDLGMYCDPCVAEKPEPAELYALGARWQYPDAPPDADPASLRRAPAAEGAGFLTRIHVRYDRQHFPEDLAFQETRDTTPFQVVYSVRHPWNGAAGCRAADDYRRGLPERFTREATNLSDLTGWEMKDIRDQMAAHGEPFEMPAPSLWDRARDLLR